MTSTQNDSLLARLDRSLAKLEDGLSFVAALFILALMVLGALNVVGRKMGMPVWGYNDIVVLSMVSFAFLSISAMQRVGGHIRMELVVRRFSGRTLWIAEFFGALIAIFIISVLIYFSFTAFMRAYELGDSTMDREIPTWPSKIWVPISFTVLLARLILQVWGYARLIINPNAEPIAVPVMQAVSEQADKEISDTFGDTETGRAS
jgi:TRAP-type C4-dicarboxylate transport system permease small subunit